MVRPVVVVSADRSLTKTVKQGLECPEIPVRVTTDVDEAIIELTENNPSLVIADYELTQDRVEDIFEQIESAHGVPIIVVVSSHDEMSQCLDRGASDFIMKPVSPGELAGRAAIHGVGGSQRAGIKALGDGLAIDTSARLATIDGETVDLASREYELLEFLASRPGVTFTREELLVSVWGSSSEFQGPATVTEHVHRLRHKLERDPDRPRWIVTVHSKGYRLQP